MLFGAYEVGLRTYIIYSTYPERFNRQAVGIITKYNFAPTEVAANNLIKEGKDPQPFMLPATQLLMPCNILCVQITNIPNWIGLGMES